jgi:glycosyltransferase involved in cell wall biosynthesis
MIRVLIMKTNMDMGVLETHIMRVFRELDKTKMCFDFLLYTKTRCYHETEIENLGGKVYHIQEKRNIRKWSELKRIINNNSYKAIIKYSENALSWIDLKIAKKCDVPVRMVRFPDLIEKNNVLVNMFNELERIISCRFATMRIVTSKANERKHFFTEQKNIETVIVNNGLQITKYQFNEITRNRIRKELNLENFFVVGNVARFYEQKNHKFIIEMFAEFVKRCPMSKLVLVGDGELRKGIEGKIGKYNISKNVLLLGLRDDIANVLMGMDVFCLPSLFETTNNSILEAQTTGLFCLASNTLSDQVNITGNVHYLSLENINNWVEILTNLYLLDNNVNDRVKSADQVKNAGYDIKEISNLLTERIYKQLKL